MSVRVEDPSAELANKVPAVGGVTAREVPTAKMTGDWISGRVKAARLVPGTLADMNRNHERMKLRIMADDTISEKERAKKLDAHEKLTASHRAPLLKQVEDCEALMRGQRRNYASLTNLTSAAFDAADPAKDAMLRMTAMTRLSRLNAAALRETLSSAVARGDLATMGCVVEELAARGDAHPMPVNREMRNEMLALARSVGDVDEKAVYALLDEYDALLRETRLHSGRKITSTERIAAGLAARGLGAK